MAIVPKPAAADSAPAGTVFGSPRAIGADRSNYNKDAENDFNESHRKSVGEQRKTMMRVLLLLPCFLASFTLGKMVT